MEIRCGIPISISLWSGQGHPPDVNLPVKVSAKLYAKVSFQNGDTNDIDSPKLPMYKSYTNITSLNYTISSNSSERYNVNQTKDKLLLCVAEDIQRIHNRLIEVMRSRTSAWQLQPISITEKNYKTELSRYKVRYRKGSRGRFAHYKYTGSLLDYYLSSSNGNAADLDDAELEEVEEWLNEGYVVKTVDELRTLAKEAEAVGNVRLATLNFVSALEQALHGYLNKALVKKPNINPEMSKKFLGSLDLSLEDKLEVILRLVIHESWLRGIDFACIRKAILVRNKIAHGEAVKPAEVLERYGQVNWRKILTHVDYLTAKLIEATLLIDSSPQIQEMSNLVGKEFNILPKIWIQKRQRVVCEVTLYADDLRSPERLSLISKRVAEIRSRQSRYFDPTKHLTVRFYDFPERLIGTWSSGKYSLAPPPQT